MIKKITIEVIPHLSQRYNTVGDWQFTRSPTGDELKIKVSDIGERDANMLIAIHEMIEAILCEFGGVTEEQVDEFDFFWTPRPAYYASNKLLTEPGDDTCAPYYTQHQCASAVERLVAMKMWTDWARYEEMVDKMVRDSEEHFAEKLTPVDKLPGRGREEISEAPPNGPLDDLDEIPF